jgi:hypothetical protein
MAYIGAGVQRFNTADELTVTGTSELKNNVTVTGDVTASGTVLPTGDTAAGDAAALGFTSAEGLILTGQGSTSDITVKNDADATVFTVPTGTDDILFPDSAKILMGAGSDLQIFHDGSNSFINNTVTGALSLKADDINLLNSSSQNMAVFTEGGAVDLYHNNSKKLATASTGIDITGAFTATDQCTITSANNTSQLVLKSTDADGSLGPKLDLVRDSSSPADGDNCGQINFFIDNDAGQSIQYGDIFVGATDVSDSTESAHMTFSTMKAGSRNSRMKLHSDETVFNEDSVDVDFRIEGATNANLLTVDAGDEAVRINTTAASPGASNTNTGMEFREAGLAFFSSASGYINLNRNADGTQLFFNKSGNQAGGIGIASSEVFFRSGETSLLFDDTANFIRPADGAGGARDNIIDLGETNNRFDDIFATNGTIQTSDENEKQNIATLTSAEMTAAKAISALFKTYKWKDKVAEKGDSARIHTGVVAQEVQTAMTNAGLDPTKYAFWCSNTWWETSTEVAAVEEDIKNGVLADIARTSITTYRTEEDAPEGATKRTRLGVRYPELLAFVGAATEQRLADIETRLATLES